MYITIFAYICFKLCFNPFYCVFIAAVTLETLESMLMLGWFFVGFQVCFGWVFLRGEVLGVK